MWSRTVGYQNNSANVGYVSMSARTGVGRSGIDYFVGVVTGRWFYCSPAYLIVIRRGWIYPVPEPCLGHGRLIGARGN